MLIVTQACDESPQGGGAKASFDPVPLEGVVVAVVVVVVVGVVVVVVGGGVDEPEPTTTSCSTDELWPAASLRFKVTYFVPACWKVKLVVAPEPSDEASAESIHEYVHGAAAQVDLVPSNETAWPV